MTDTDDLARRLIANQITHAERSLARDAAALAEEAQRFAAGVVRFGPVDGDANRLAQSAIQLAARAARLDAMRETASIFLPVDGGEQP